MCRVSEVLHEGTRFGHRRVEARPADRTPGAADPPGAENIPSEAHPVKQIPGLLKSHPASISPDRNLGLDIPLAFVKHLAICFNSRLTKYSVGIKMAENL